MVAEAFPLPIVSLGNQMTRALLPSRQRARIMLGPDSPLTRECQPGDTYRLTLQDITPAPPTNVTHPWRFVKARHVLACRVLVTAPPPLPPPVCRDREHSAAGES